MVCGTVIAFLLIIISLVAFFVRKRYSKLEELGFLHEKPEFPFGNMKGIGKKFHLVHILKRSYDKFSKQAPIHGLYMFLNANFVVTDLDLAKDILIRDFENFRNRGIFSSKKHDPLTAHLLAIEDQEWRNMRHKLTPTFTSGKMKMMFHTVLDVSNHMIQKLKLSNNLENVEMKELIASFMTDVIGNVAFGLEMNSIEDPNSKFREMGRKFFTEQNFIINALILTNFRKFAQKIGMKLIPTEISDFFRSAVRDTVEYRRQNNIERNDVLNLLMKIGNEGREGEEKLTIDEIAAQCFVFFVAGHETSSSAATHALYFLTINPEMQEKLRDEIKTVLAKNDNKLTYEAINEMKYLDMVVNETLRLTPPVPAVIRQASRDYKVANTNLIIPKGALVMTPVIWIHRDPAYYPDPEKFDPERFNDDNKAKRHPMAHIPFGDGPRNCIGNRFGLMQTKITLIQLLNNFRFHKTPTTPEKLIFDPKSTTLQSKVTIKLKFEKLN